MNTSLLGNIITAIGLFLGVVVTAKYTKNEQLIRLDMTVKELVKTVPSKTEFTQLKTVVDELDKKVTKHNSLVERTYAL